jgi:hypothetical protein
LSLGHWSFDPPPSPLAPSHNTRGFTNMSVTFGRVRHSSLGIRHFSGCYHADLSVKPDPANRLPIRPVSNTARRTRHAPREPAHAASSLYERTNGLTLNANRTVVLESSSCRD